MECVRDQLNAAASGWPFSPEETLLGLLAILVIGGFAGAFLRTYLSARAINGIMGSLLVILGLIFVYAVWFAEMIGGGEIVVKVLC